MLNVDITVPVCEYIKIYEKCKATLKQIYFKLFKNRWEIRNCVKLPNEWDYCVCKTIDISE